MSMSKSRSKSSGGQKRARRSKFSDRVVCVMLKRRLAHIVMSSVRSITREKFIILLLSRNYT